MATNEIDDDIPQLSAETFLALKDFYREQDESEMNAFHLKADSNADTEIDIKEDWQLSQFWYDSDTIKKLVKIALETISQCGKIALISCPSLYKTMKNEASENCIIHLYEYDKRFSIYGEDFTYYDYRNPLNIPKNKREYYDIVIADPPFLSDECLTKAAVTIKYLTKQKIMLCTGSTMADMAERLLSLKKTTLNPKHQNNLANEFCCYANFEINCI